jgi:hypothetical protein
VKKTDLPQARPTKPRGNVITAAQLDPARPIARACYALVEVQLRSYWDFDDGDETDRSAIPAPSELVSVLP